MAAASAGVTAGGSTVPEETIIFLTLPSEAIDLIEEDDAVGALHPSHYPAPQHTAMTQVFSLAERLTGFQPLLLLNGLQHALEAEHEGVALFATLETKYELEGIGLEVKDDVVTEEGSKGPVRFTFIESEVADD